MRIDVVTLFPEFFDGPLGTGLVGKAIAEGRAEVHCTNPRTFTSDVHRTVDDTPYGGGAGMVMKPEPLAAAIEAARGDSQAPVLLMSPQGAPLTQRALERWSAEPRLVLVAGRYEGFDDRVRGLVDAEVSLGDFVLTGGEYAALTLVDGLVRLLPGTLGNAASHAGDSFSAGLLEHPQYTRPPVFREATVPDVLKSGDHGRIAAWRRAEGVRRTAERRPELLRAVPLDDTDRRGLWERAAPAPVELLAPASAAEIPAWTRLAAAYDVRVGLYGAGDAAALAAAPEVAMDWPNLPPKRRRDTPEPRRVAPADRLEALTPAAALADPTRACVALARRPTRGPHLAPADLRAVRADGRRWTVVLGGDLVDAKGRLAEGVVGALPTLRVGTPDNDLPALAAGAVVLDRIVGERSIFA